MDKQSADTAMRDCEVPGHVVEVNGKLIRVSLLNEMDERLEVREYGLSDFADLILDWCGRLLRRGEHPGAKATSQAPHAITGGAPTAQRAKPL